MTLSHDEANARLLELVYGEASAVEGAALEAHVATCARCTAELAALGDARARLRAALDDGDAPAPARAHARILGAANEAAAAVLARAGGPKAATSRAQRFWERLRGRWTFPTLATVGALAVVVIASKVFLEPERTMEAGREAVTGAAPPVAAPAESPPPPSAPAAPSEPTAAAAPVLDPGVLERLSDAAAKRARSSIGGSRPGLLGAASATQRLARAHGSGGAPTALGGVGGGVGSQGAGSGVGAVSAAPSAGALDDDMVASARRAAKPVAKDESASAPPGGYARPPAGWKGGAASPSSGAASRTAAPPAVAALGGAVAPPPASAPAAPAARSSGAAASRAQTVPTRRALGKRDVVNDALAEGEATGGSAHAGAAPESDVLRQEEKAEKAERADEDKRARVESTGKVSDEPRARALKKAAPAPAKSADATSEDDKERKPDEGASREALARRADELFAARRWSDAIAAYRELLRRYPEADLKARWRARITRAQAATEAPTDGADRAAAKAATTSRGSTKAKSEPQPAPAE